MDLHSHFKRLFEYDDWANRQALSSLQALASPPPKAVRLMAHVVGVEFVWLARLQGKPDPAVWPEWTVPEISEHQKVIVERVRAYLGSLSGDALGREVHYKNTKGELWQNTVSDILMHTVMHSAYHRGQIAMVLRDSGATPPYTDFIQAVRAHCFE